MTQKNLFCTKCGAELKGSFCSKCGNQVIMESGESAVNKEKNQPNTNKEPLIENNTVTKNSIRYDNPLDELLPEIKPLQQPIKNKGVGKGCLISFLIVTGFVVVTGVVGSLIFRTVIQKLFSGISGNIPIN